ncbi:MAG: glutamate 5-kinase [Planctomycetota bacterium]|nr:glutamate 5-kinase [Planctomycetota bacterium]
MPDRAVRGQIIAQAERIVVKVGTNAITDDVGRLDERVVKNLARQISAVIASGASVTLVASGAIGAGMGELDMTARPKTLPMLQAAAAVGQGQLMRAFHDVFAEHGVRVAQVLLTRDDFDQRSRYLNIRNTLAALAELGALAIINENDAVAVDEIRFSDNDVIAALLANMIGADLLVLLTVADGVLRGGRVLDVIEQVDEKAMSLAGSQRSRLGSGGMRSKIEAAGLVTRAGEVAAIANARTKDVLTRLLAGERIGTVFLPARRKMSSLKRWISQAARPTGKIVIDDGAARVLKQQGKSLLPSGIVTVNGRFGKGATVTVVDSAGRQVARGLTNYSAEQIGQIKGLKTTQIAGVLGDKPYDEVIHRNNMALG